MLRSRRLRFGVMGMLAVLGAASPGGSLPIDFGVRTGAYLEDADPFLGFELFVPLGASDWYFNPNVEAVLGERRDRVAFNADFTVGLRETKELFVYGGAGVGIWRLDADPPRERRSRTEGGFNLLGGVAWRVGNLAPYAQVKIVVAEDAQVVAGVGLRF